MESGPGVGVKEGVPCGMLPWRMSWVRTVTVE